MIVTPEFVFLHLQKTGGSFINAALRQHCDVLLERPHATDAEIPEAFRHLPVFGVVRQPWDWYVSWHHHRLRIPTGEGDAWWLLSDGGRLGFEQTVRNACGEIDAPIGHYLRRRDRDLYTALWWRMFGTRVEVGRFENLRGDFIAFLDRHEAGSRLLRLEVLTSNRVNAGEREPWEGYYSPELYALVAHKARLLRRTFYGFAATEGSICTGCDGSGEAWGEPCGFCGGSGLDQSEVQAPPTRA